jgi:hypothetical protein
VISDEMPRAMSCTHPNSAFGFFLSTLAFLLSSCASHHFQVSAGGPPNNVPRYLELRADKRVATLHFPAGIYSFYAVDDTGYYYRAPRPVFQHTSMGATPRNGGIFVSKRHPTRLRGYIFYAGALTHVGNLSHAAHEFRD